MDSRNHGFLALILLIISSILCSQSRADGTGSVFFLDSSTQPYFRSRSSESQSLLLPEIGAAISVLLGFTPPLTLSPTSSKKLDEVLLPNPNPFDRPHAVFVLEINGVEDKGPGVGMDSDVFISSLKSRVALGENFADIQLSDEEVSLVSLNEPLPSDMEFTDDILDDFASWLGGSYVRNIVKSLSGELTVLLANDVQLKLHMSKNADREFTKSLVSVIQNVQRVVQMHQDFSGSTHSPAELVMGRFDGVKALKDQYGTNEIVQQGVELLVTSVSKIYDLLQKVYKGQIVGVVLFNGSPAKESGTMLRVTFTSRPASCWLEERNGWSPRDRLIAEVVLVQRTLVWITRSILIMATLLGIYFLMKHDSDKGYPSLLKYEASLEKLYVSHIHITILIPLYMYCFLASGAKNNRFPIIFHNYSFGVYGFVDVKKSRVTTRVVPQWFEFGLQRSKVPGGFRFEFKEGKKAPCDYGVSNAVTPSYPQTGWSPWD